MADNPIARLQQLDQERAEVVTRGKKEALDRANAVISDLHALGFNYQLVETAKRAKQPTGNTARMVKDAACPVCKFKTTPPHDARKHRAQGKRKKPFTSADLEAFALEKV